MSNCDIQIKSDLLKAISNFCNKKSFLNVVDQQPRDILGLCEEFVPGNPPEFFFDRNPENFGTILEMYRCIISLTIKFKFSMFCNICLHIVTFTFQGLVSSIYPAQGEVSIEIKYQSLPKGDSNHLTHP